MTGQQLFDRYVDAGAFAAVDLVNHIRDPVTGLSADALREILAVDLPSVAQLRDEHVAGFTSLAEHLDATFAHLDRDELDEAASRLNGVLAAHPAHPHLSKEGGRWRLHHHPAEAHLVPMWSSICAENLARIIAVDNADRLGTCQASGCRRVFLDESKNTSRRFCSMTCNNRVRSATYRHRHNDRSTRQRR